jgi:hypothetical protein
MQVLHGSVAAVRLHALARHTHRHRTQCTRASHSSPDPPGRRSEAAAAASARARVHAARRPTRGGAALLHDPLAAQLLPEEEGAEEERAEGAEGALTAGDVAEGVTARVLDAAALRGVRSLGDRGGQHDADFTCAPRPAPSNQDRLEGRTHRVRREEQQRSTGSKGLLVAAWRRLGRQERS